MRYAILRPALTTRRQRWHRADVTASRDRGARVGRIEGESFSRLPTADREERLSKLDKVK